MREGGREGERERVLYLEKPAPQGLPVWLDLLTPQQKVVGPIEVFLQS